MTIKRGQQWGDVAEVPSDLPIAVSNKELSALLNPSPSAGRGAPERPSAIVVNGGDLARTCGFSVDRVDESFRARCVVDLVEVQINTDERYVAASHVIVLSRGVQTGVLSAPRGPRRIFTSIAPTWWRGDLVAVMNAQFVGTADIAPRSHPNDGMLDVLTVRAAMSLRDRWTMFRRLATGTHLPHPDIEVLRTPNRQWEFATPRSVLIDDAIGVDGVGGLRVTVLPDALTVYV